MSMKVQLPVRAGESDDTLRFIQQMGIGSVSLMLQPEELTCARVCAEQERLARFGLTVSDALCQQMQKNKSIHLALPGRDEQIDRFCAMLRVFGQCGIPFTSIAWQPNGILRTAHRAGAHTRGGISAYADQDEILARPDAEGRRYTEAEIWDNFAYFLARALPAAEESHVAMALHPNDPPLACMAGIPSLIWNSDGYRRAFALAHGSPYLGMKLCVGCWLEGGSAFGDLMADIREFCAAGRILCVHFRNVDSTLPRFEETLAEDGYADMYAILKQLVACGCSGVISVDHAFRPLDGFGGMAGSFAYPTGYLKGLLDAAERETAAGRQR